VNGSKTLVLGGGGLAGLGWYAGLFHGLAQSGVDLRDADRMIGTSAGSVTAVQMRGADSLEQLYARQTDPALIADETPPDMSAMMALMAAFPKLNAIADHGDRMRAIGKMATDEITVTPDVRRAMIERRLSSHEWPKASLTITAVNVDTGNLQLFDATSGVSLVDAIAASCAVPGVWPVVTVDGRRYMDGGVFTVDNAALAMGAERVVIASPFSGASPATAGYHLNDAVAALEASGSKVLVIEPDAATRAAMGVNPLDPAVRKPSAEAGFIQGKQLAENVGKFWSEPR
jgi:NTE family protein